MSNAIKQQVLHVLEEKGEASTHTLVTELGVSRQYIHKALKELVLNNIVIKVGAAPKVIYRMTNTSKPKSQNIVAQDYEVTKQSRLARNNQKASILWFTGLSGSGKSTLANAVEKRLFDLGKHTYVLDGDNVRHGLNKDLAFSAQDRVENIRRIGEVAKLFVDSGQIALTAFISPYIADRNMVRALVDKGEFVEIFVDCALEVCEQRDVKGLYKKAREGQIKGFTGIDAPYETPVEPEITVHTDAQSIEASVDQIVAFLQEHKYIRGEA